MIRRHHVARSLRRYSKFPEADILRYLPCRVSRCSSFPLPPCRHPRRLPPPEVHSKTNSPAPSWIISTSLGTSWRRQCGGFIHRSVYFRFVLPSSPSYLFSIIPGFSLLPAGLTCCCTDASSPIYSPCRNARYYFRHSILPPSIIGSRSSRREKGREEKKSEQDVVVYTR